MKTIFTFILLVFAVNGFAQTERKTWHLGGGFNAGFDTGNYDFTPNGLYLQNGYFLKKKLEIGLHLSSEYYSLKNYDNGKFTTGRSYVNATFTPFIRYYLGKSDWKPYVQGMAGVVYKVFRQSFNDANASVISNSYFYPTATVGAGISYFPYKNWGIEAGLDYRLIDNFPDNTYWSSPLALRIGLKSVIPSKK
jgi:Outer membrane protein beta-barrel domain